MVDSVSPAKDHLPRFCSAMKVLKGKDIISSDTEMGVRVVTPLPLHAGLSTSRDLSLGAVLFTQLVHERTEGEAGKRSGHLLIT